jgi:hypothetical protein
MSTTPQPTRNEDKNSSTLGERMLNNAKQTLRDIAYRYEEEVSQCHASVVYNERFWRDLQQTLEEYAYKKTQLMKAGGYDSVAAELALIEQRGIRTAVEEFRYSVQETPHGIHEGDRWGEFMDEITTTPD